MGKLVHGWDYYVTVYKGTDRPRCQDEGARYQVVLSCDHGGICGRALCHGRLRGS